MTEEGQFDFAGKLGDLIGWSLFNKSSKYIESHARQQQIASSGPDDVLVRWHIEHTYYVNPIVAATWNMYNFKTNIENGKTYFVDTGVIFEMLSEEEKQFLIDSTICEPPALKEQQINAGFASNATNLAEQYPIIKSHWLTGKPIIRFTVDPSPFMVDLALYKGREPELDTVRYFKSLIRKIEDIIKNNEDIRIVHRWQQGDLVIPDLFKLAHAVTGGFKPEDREFRGIWCYKK